MNITLNNWIDELDGFRDSLPTIESKYGQFVPVIDTGDLCYESITKKEIFGIYCTPFNDNIKGIPIQVNYANDDCDYEMMDKRLLPDADSITTEEFIEQIQTFINTHPFKHHPK